MHETALSATYTQPDSGFEGHPIIPTQPPFLAHTGDTIRLGFPVDAGALNEDRVRNGIPIPG